MRNKVQSTTTYNDVQYLSHVELH